MVVCFHTKTGSRGERLTLRVREKRPVQKRQHHVPVNLYVRAEKSILAKRF